ncbi:prepilin peptidase [Tessaracoccus sp.]
MTSADLAALTPALYVLVGVFGLLIGSFLNVVIWRVPQGLSIIRPASACPACGHQITPPENIPILSWVFLRGRCSSCRSRISLRYPIVEATVGTLFVLMAWKVGFTPILPLWLYLAAAGTALFLIDVDHKRLPDVIVLPSWGVVLVGVLGAAVFAPNASTHLAHAGWGALAFTALYSLIFYGTLGRGMGFGDVKLAPILGAALGWFGWGSTLVGLLGGFVIGGVVGIGLIAFGSMGRKARIPHGPFMLTGTLLGLLAGPQLWDWYLNFVGLT